MGNVSDLLIRSVDVGYGNTKYIRFSDEKGKMTWAMFPSVAPRAADKNLSAGVLGRRNTVLVSVNGNNYEVGEDAAISRVSHGRVLDGDYCLSDHYAAILYGALSMMSMGALNTLVLGLPVSTFPTHKDRLAAKFKGEHKISSDKTIAIKEVMVVPQPIGGFYDYAVRTNKIATMKSEVNLIIDPGYFTLDWVVTHGTKPIEARSAAATNGGMSAILTAMGEEIQKDIGKDIGDVSRIDLALRNKTPYKVHGKEVVLEKYLSVGHRIADEAINKMVYSVGSMADIDNVVLVGGGAHFFKEVIQRRVSQPIGIGDDAVYSNVRGFQFIGEELARRKQKNRAAS